MRHVDAVMCVASALLSVWVYQLTASLHTVQLKNKRRERKNQHPAAASGKCKVNFVEGHASGHISSRSSSSSSRMAYPSVHAQAVNAHTARPVGLFSCICICILYLPHCVCVCVHACVRVCTAILCALLALTLHLIAFSILRFCWNEQKHPFMVTAVACPLASSWQQHFNQRACGSM